MMRARVATIGLRQYARVDYNRLRLSLTKTEVYLVHLVIDVLDAPRVGSLTMMRIGCVRTNWAS
jgi:hypothetical protein